MRFTRLCGSEGTERKMEMQLGDDFAQEKRIAEIALERQCVSLLLETADEISAKLQIAQALSMFGHRYYDDCAKAKAFEALKEIRAKAPERFWTDTTIQGAFKQVLKGERINLDLAACQDLFYSAVKLVSSANSNPALLKLAKYELSLSYLASELGTDVLLARETSEKKLNNKVLERLRCLAQEAKKEALISRVEVNRAFDELAVTNRQAPAVCFRLNSKTL